MKKRMDKKQIAAFLIGVICLGLVVAFIFLTGRENRKKEPYTTTGFAMGTVVTTTVYSEQGRKDAAAILQCLESLENETISWRSETSEVYQVNHAYDAGVPYPIGAELARYILMAQELSRAGGGLLDITIRPLASLWGIEDGKETVPEKAEMEEALRLVDYTKVHVVDSDGKEYSRWKDIKAEQAYFVLFDKTGMSLDFGAIGKGIACDRIADYLKTTKASGACIAVGGSIVCYGSKPDGASYQIGIQNPRGEQNDVMGVLKLEAGSQPVFVSTSGDYEKYFIQDGKRYHHILNPVTGYPADSGTISATIIADNGALSDALSTLCILLDKEQALQLVEQYGADAILVDDAKQVYMTDGIENNFEITDGEYKKQ